MNTEPLIRVSVSIKRNPSLSEEEFNKYWAHHHGPLAAKWLKRCGILRYVQYHTPIEYRNLGKNMSDALGRPMLDYDGVGDFWVRKYEDFEAAFQDPEYVENIRPDEIKFVDMDSLRVTVGVEYVCIDNGKVVEEHERDFS